MADNPGHSVQLIFSKRNILRFVSIGFVTILVCLMVLDALFIHLVIVPNEQIMRIFNIAGESSVPTWFSVMLLIAVSLSAVFILVTQRTSLTCRQRIIWSLIALFFLFMSIDDAAEIHERLGRAFEGFVKEQESTEYSGFVTKLVGEWPSFYWQVVVFPFFVLAGICMCTALLGELRDNRGRALMLLSFLCLGLAVGLDHLQGREGVHDEWATQVGIADYYVVHFANVTEESLEMVGAALMLLCFLRHGLQPIKQIEIQFQE